LGEWILRAFAGNSLGARRRYRFSKMIATTCWYAFVNQNNAFPTKQPAAISN
jgi:hypothetical protein